MMDRKDQLMLLRPPGTYLWTLRGYVRAIFICYMLVLFRVKDWEARLPALVLY